MTRISFVFLAFFTSFLFVAAAHAQSSDLLLFNGHIITVDSHDSIAQALLIATEALEECSRRDEHLQIVKPIADEALSRIRSVPTE